jgi:cold shock CspA family protein
MARSKETFGKREKEKQRLKHKQDKLEKMQERKANATKGKPLEEMMAYIDENGNLSSTPPDAKKMRQFKLEEMNTGVPVREAEETEKHGIVSFFNDAKGFGFIKDGKTGESIFMHTSQLLEFVKENDKVSFEVEKGPRGLSALNVKKIS